MYTDRHGDQIEVIPCEPRRVFVNSMSDLFHKDVPSEFIAQVFAVMAQTPRHTYQILTKRHARMRHLVGGPIDGGCNLLEALTDEAEVLALYDALWPLTNVHLGVSVENQHWASIRIPALQQTQAETRFLSCEPLVGPIPELDLDGIDWVIIGGESGPRARTMDPDWAREIIGQCRAAAVPVFVKQMGTIWARSTKFNGMSVARLGDPKGGKTEWWPTDLQVQEFPQQPRAGAA